jgi:D-alanyl-D-alanine carboxypeptidase/D-alanyl-D-alanine-endopeptidase (penicillin-binding protein 4)
MRGGLHALIVVLIAAFAAPADARPSRPGKHRAVGKRGARPDAQALAPDHLQPKARIAVSILGAARPPSDKRAKPTTAIERIANAIETLYKGPLRAGTTSLYVVDATTGAPVFAVDPDQPLNPASNVKLISTATALDLLGPDFRYLTRVLGKTPDAAGEVGDLYLLGSYDPTLRADDVRALAARLAATGVRAVRGDVVVGPVGTRDGIYRSLVPLEIVSGAKAGDPIAVTTRPGYDFVTVVSTATTQKSRRARLTFAEAIVTDPEGRTRLQVTITGGLPRNRSVTRWTWTNERALHAAHVLRAGLREAGVDVRGDVRVEDLADTVGAAATAGWIPLELARHESAPLSAIVAQVNKRSINWLSDRVIMTAAARAYGGQPSMELAIEAMYRWLGAKTAYGRDDLVVDTGSGLSRETRFSTRQIVDVLRIAAGYAAAPDGPDPARAKAYFESLSVAASDGTLRARFKGTPIAAHLRGKTGTLRDVVALAGILDVDPARPLAFALVTNGHPESLKVRVKKAHEQLVGLLCDYVHATGTPAAAPVAAPVAAPAPAAALPSLLSAGEPAIRDAEDVEETDRGAPEVTADREDVEQMVKEDQVAPVLPPTLDH